MIKNRPTPLTIGNSPPPHEETQNSRSSKKCVPVNRTVNSAGKNKADKGIEPYQEEACNFKSRGLGKPHWGLVSKYLLEVREHGPSAMWDHRNSKHRHPAPGVCLTLRDSQEADVTRAGSDASLRRDDFGAKRRGDGMGMARVETAS